MTKTRGKSAARQRIIETAERLFYAEGIRSVGIDRIIAEAAVAKMTLYNHFSSKDELILAVLEYREQQFDQFLQSAIERFMAGGLDRLHAFFAALREWFASPGFRGCSFINAVVELADADHPASRFATCHKQKFRQMLEGVLIESAGPEAAAAAPALAVLVEGAIVTAVMEGKPDAADIARDATISILSNLQRQ